MCIYCNLWIFLQRCLLFIVFHCCQWFFRIVHVSNHFAVPVPDILKPWGSEPILAHLGQAPSSSASVFCNHMVSLSVFPELVAVSRGDLGVCVAISMKHRFTYIYIYIYINKYIIYTVLPMVTNLYWICIEYIAIDLRLLNMSMFIHFGEWFAWFLRSLEFVLYTRIAKGGSCVKLQSLEIPIGVKFLHLRASLSELMDPPFLLIRPSCKPDYRNL